MWKLAQELLADPGVRQLKIKEIQAQLIQHPANPGDLKGVLHNME